MGGGNGGENGGSGELNVYIWQWPLKASEKNRYPGKADWGRMG
jgi:hypothetical protein